MTDDLNLWLAMWYLWRSPGTEGLRPRLIDEAQLSMEDIEIFCVMEAHYSTILAEHREAQARLAAFHG